LSRTIEINPLTVKVMVWFVPIASVEEPEVKRFWFSCQSNELLIASGEAAVLR
jgi:hypothetical protein